MNEIKGFISLIETQVKCSIKEGKIEVSDEKSLLYNIIEEMVLKEEQQTLIKNLDIQRAKNPTFIFKREFAEVKKRLIDDQYF